MEKSSSATHRHRVQSAIQERREHERQELRQLILKAAGELFLEVGYEQFSVRKLAERIGYSATTVYLYFTDKDGLFLQSLMKASRASLSNFMQQLLVRTSHCIA